MFVMDVLNAMQKEKKKCFDYTRHDFKKHLAMQDCLFELIKLLKRTYKEEILSKFNDSFWK